MQINVRSIKPCDRNNLSKMEAIVDFYDNEAELHNCATVEVFIDKEDRTLSEIKKDAVEAAVEFLRLAVASYTAQSVNRSVYISLQ